MQAVLTHPANSGVIASLCRKRHGVGSIVGFDPSRPPEHYYLECGSHPEIVERVWDQLGRDLPAGRYILCGTPVLADPDSGILLAVSYGTAYALRIPEGSLADALRAGCTTSQRWTGGSTTDLTIEFGRDWVFGRWAKEEEAWCRAVIAACAPCASQDGN